MRNLTLALRMFALTVLPPGLPAAAAAAPVEHQGLLFSDELGGFTLLGVTGKGTIEDPIVVVEDVTGDRAITLVIRNFSRDFGNRVGTVHEAAMAMKKIVINHSDRVWTNYQMELREVTTRHSPYSDGLSFGQNSAIGTDYVLSNFPDLQRFDEPEDTLGFSGAQVPPGGRAEFRFIVSDMSPVWQFFIVQVPLQPLSELKPGRAGARELAEALP